jgi:protein-disulfide isomerase
VTKTALLLAAAAVAAMPAAAAAAPAGRAAPARVDWARTVVATPEGGFRMGNPDAAVKLVEYTSLSCPHCAAFAEQATAELSGDFVSSGKVSWEVRPYMLFPTDPGVSLLLACRGPQEFFETAGQLYASQKEWLGRLMALPEDRAVKLMESPPLETQREFVRIAGLDTFFRERGMSAAEIDACLADEARLEKAVALNRLGNAEGVSGTPAFFINGSPVEDVVNWAKLRPTLARAMPR